MTTSKTFFFIIHLFTFHIATTMCTHTCPETRCPGSDIPIRFPFGLRDRIDQRCGYNSSFDLSCDDQNRVIITLPSGEFTVKSLDYEFGELSINDPESCLARRLLATNFTVDPPFRFASVPNPVSYTFLNCTPNVTDMPYAFVPIACLSGQNYTVAAVSTVDYAQFKAPCSMVSEALVPVGDMEDPVVDGGDVPLRWDLSGCHVCELVGETCGFVGDTGNDVGCSAPSNLPQSNKGNKGLWAIVAVVVPMILVVVWFMFCCTFGARPQQTQPHQYSISLGVIVNNNNNGLDRATIESYPKTELRDPTNNTCSICLSEYKLGDTIRTIPSCQHYFHVNCIDEWLQKSETCPLCRNIPLSDGSSLVNPSLPATAQP